MDDIVDVLEDVDGGIGDLADRPNAGEGELNRIPLSFASACGGEGQKGQIVAARFMRGISAIDGLTYLLVPLRQTLHPV